MKNVVSTWTAPRLTDHELSAVTTAALTGIGYYGDYIAVQTESRVRGARTLEELLAAVYLTVADGQIVAASSATPTYDEYGLVAVLDALAPHAPDGAYLAIDDGLSAVVYVTGGGRVHTTDADTHGVLVAAAAEELGYLDPQEADVAADPELRALVQRKATAVCAAAAAAISADREPALEVARAVYSDLL